MHNKIPLFNVFDKLWLTQACDSRTMSKINDGYVQCGVAYISLSMSILLYV